MKPWDDIVLTEQEKEAAILEGKKRKYFHEKNKDYWVYQEKPKKDYKKLMDKHEKSVPASIELGERIDIDAV